MAFYNIREAAIQDPNNTGVDLDQVEKDVAGSDGIEAHRDEIDAAEEGVVGEPLDPVEEAFNIMYESEYNYNQILRCIGLHELTEASYGRELIFEAADIKGFFTRVKEFFVKMFRRITETVKKVLAKLDFQVKADKKFVTKYKKEIEEGAKLGVDFEGYDYDTASEMLDLSHLSSEIAEEFKDGKNISDVEAVKKILDDISASRDEQTASKAYATYIDDSAGVDLSFVGIMNTLGFTIENEGDFVKKYTELLRGKKIKQTSDVNLAKKVIDILSKERETATIREDYKKIKQGFDKTIKGIQELENKIKRDDEFAALKIKACNHLITVEKTAKHIANVVYNVHMKVARAKRAQYRALAHKFVSAYNKKNGEKKTEVHHNSAMFNGINII